MKTVATENICKWKQIHKPQAIWACVLSLGLSFSIVAGWLYEKTSFLSFTPKTTLLLVVLFIVFIFPFYLLLVRTTCNQHSKAISEWKPSKRDLCIAVILMAVPQFILWLIAWPGVYSHDAPFIVFQLNPTEDAQVPVGTQFSVAYTVVLGGFIRITKQFISLEAGFACVMFFQASVLIYAQFKASRYVGVESKSKVFFWITVSFFAFNPFGMVMRISACQDVLFYAFLLLVVIDAFRVGKLLFACEDIDFKLIAHLGIMIIFMCLFRNNGIYLYAVAILLILPAFLKRKQLKPYGLLVLPILITLVITGPVCKACGVVDSGVTIQEMASVTSQQLARSIANNPKSLTEEDKAEIDRFYNHLTDDVSWYWDVSEIADTAKRKINQQAVKDDPVGYFKIYFQVGLKNVDNFRDAFLMNVLGWWYPFKTYPDTRMYHNYLKYDTMEKLDYEGTFIKIERQSLFPEVDNFISRAINSGKWSRIPGLNLLFVTAGYTWIFITLCVIALLKKEKSALFAFLITVGLILTYLIGPVCYYRYSYSMIVCLPLLMLVCFRKPPSRSKEQ